MTDDYDTDPTPPHGIPRPGPECLQCGAPMFRYCLRCGESLEGRRRSAVFCSKSCRYDQFAEDRQVAAAAERLDAVTARAETRIERRRRVLGQR